MRSYLELNLLHNDNKESLAILVPFSARNVLKFAQLGAGSECLALIGHTCIADYTPGIDLQMSMPPFEGYTAVTAFKREDRTSGV